MKRISFHTEFLYPASGMSYRILVVVVKMNGGLCRLVGAGAQCQGTEVDFQLSLLPSLAGQRLDQGECRARRGNQNLRTQCPGRLKGMPSPIVSERLRSRAPGRGVTR